MKILAVEDDPAIAGFLGDGFRQLGYNIVCVADGEAGLAAAQDPNLDVAIVDVMLPRLDGLSLIRRLRQRGVRLPVIVLSARGSVNAKVAGLEAGGDDYIAKPFSFDELAARVHALLRRAAGRTSPELLRAAGLEMDLLTHRVRRDGERIELQPLEYQLLEYLMRNKGRVVTKTAIMENVWDYRFNPHTNVVETRICRLREKIDAGGRPQLIRTIRGFGYVLEEP